VRRAASSAWENCNIVSRYRDRAAERRQGVSLDYADVVAVWYPCHQPNNNCRVVFFFFDARCSRRKS
jgi:hypothetical protein